MNRVQNMPQSPRTEFQRRFFIYLQSSARKASPSR